MKIKKMFDKGTVFSFEIFPPKKTSPVDTIYKTLEELKGLSPDFISVTFGAGGSSNNNASIEIARKIDTFETSIEPYEDCCTVFTPKHPKVRPRLEDVEKAQNSFDFEPLIQKAVEETELKIFEYNK